MRTTVDIPDELMKKAKMKAIEEGLSLKDLLTRILEKELAETSSKMSTAPWKQLKGKGSAATLNPGESGFDDYSGPDWHAGLHVNEPDKE